MIVSNLVQFEFAETFTDIISKYLNLYKIIGAKDEFRSWLRK